jgi:D-alanyl-lipoteichoic acid acyltransferase DltB (MBOAT superfamily)
MIGSRGHRESSILWLIISSLLFYGYWNYAYLWLIILSVLFNYSISFLLRNQEKFNKKSLLIIGIVGNLSALGYFKYFNFFIENINIIAETNLTITEIILPLGISFFTFQQITYLVDSYYNITEKCSFLHYCLFVVFFPQLIAGPIVRHKEIIPQFIKKTIYKLRYKDLAIGGTIFIIGLFKKTVIADGISIYPDSLFSAAEIGMSITFIEAWIGSIAYTLQIYFDFSGYSDMAIGLARMFGIRLPLNFNSPYKSTNISDFWRRWHMSLSSLIRDYLWYPLQLSLTRTSFNNNLNQPLTFVLTILYPAILTFLLVGLWHGADYNFIIFGLVHGVYIVIQNLWYTIKKKNPRIKIIKSSLISMSLGWIITFTSVIFAMVIFRSESVNSIKNIIGAMIGFNKISLPSYFKDSFSILPKSAYENIFTFDGVFVNGLYDNVTSFFIWIIVLFILIALPNTQQLMSKYYPTIGPYEGINKNNWIKWRPNFTWTLIISILLLLAITSITRINTFIYFQF